MDEEQFKQLKLSTTAIACPFEKSIQQLRHDCRLAKRLNIGERVSVACGEEGASHRCKVFLGALRDKSGFAMGRKDRPVAISYRHLMQLQLGGLSGLATALSAINTEDPHVTASPIDIVSLLDAAEHRYGGVETYPYSEIMRALVHTQVRPQSRQR